MATSHSAQRTRTIAGVLLLLAAAALTFTRARAVAEPRAALPLVTAMHREGRASDGALSNAQYHAAKAERSYQERWHLTGYATQGAVAGLVGLALILVRRRTREG